MPGQPDPFILTHILLGWQSTITCASSHAACQDSHPPHTHLSIQLAKRRPQTRICAKSKAFSLSFQWLARIRVTAESIWAHLSQPLGASIALSSPVFLRRGHFWVITPGEMSELQNPQQFLLTCLCSSLPGVPAFVTAHVIHCHGLSRQAAKYHPGARSLHPQWDGRENLEKNQQNVWVEIKTV